jgi:hypothetical protein
LLSPYLHHGVHGIHHPSNKNTAVINFLLLVFRASELEKWRQNRSNYYYWKEEMEIINEDVHDNYVADDNNALNKKSETNNNVYDLLDKILPKYIR